MCVGFNHADHAREAGLQPPAEPMFVMKAATALSAPTDDWGSWCQSVLGGDESPQGRVGRLPLSLQRLAAGIDVRIGGGLAL